jgi:hypothetical protein
MPSSSTENKTPVFQVIHERTRAQRYRVAKILLHIHNRSAKGQALTIALRPQLIRQNRDRCLLAVHSSPEWIKSSTEQDGSHKRSARTSSLFARSNAHFSTPYSGGSMVSNYHFRPSAMPRRHTYRICPLLRACRLLRFSRHLSVATSAQDVALRKGAMPCPALLMRQCGVSAGAHAEPWLFFFFFSAQI